MHIYQEYISEKRGTSTRQTAARGLCPIVQGNLAHKKPLHPRTLQ